jgi:hypothetical protein
MMVLSAVRIVVGFDSEADRTVRGPSEWPDQMPHG